MAGGPEFEEVRDASIRPSMSVRELLEAYRGIHGFMAGHLAEAVDLLREGLRESRLRVLSFTANLVATGLRGVLRDLAVPMLASAKPDYLEIWQEAPGTRQLPELERQRYGWTHADVASWMCEAWSFPKPLRDAIEGHHTTADTAQIPVAVQVAALLEHHEDDPEALIEEGRDRFNLDPDLLELALHEGKEGGDRLAIAMAR